MKSKIIHLFKMITVASICVITLLNAIISAIPLAKADSGPLLGTNRALGSPILNNEATIDNWNKWEMICWGVFLSNFCQPLVDNYRSAFQPVGEGSNGAGMKALKFGTGNDATNNKTIEDFCSQAITYQEQQTPEPVYVTFVDVTDGEIGEKPDETADGFKDSLRQANFNDFFIRNKEEDDLPYITVRNVKTDSMNILTLNTGRLPVFYVKGTSEKYIEILDYTNGWDLQMIAAIYNSVKNENETAFKTNFNKFYEGGEAYPVTMDTFGNLLVNQKMLFPGCANQHLTSKKSINILNSWITNGYISTYSRERVIQGLQQSNAGWTIFGNEGIAGTGASGTPAFGYSDIGQVGLLYFDSDSAIIDDNGKTSERYGDAISEVFDSSIDSTQNSLPLKFEISGGTLNKGFKSVIIGEEEPFQNTLVAAQVVTNCTKSSNNCSNILHEIQFPNGESSKIFDDDPVVIGVKIIRDSEDAGIKAGNCLRLFWNFLYEVYRGKYKENTAVVVDRQSLKSQLEACDTIGELGDALKNANFWKAFQSAYTQYSDKNMPSSTFDAFKNESFSAGASRICLVYPVSKVMRNVSSVLAIKDGTEFGVYSPYIYVTYLDWYGVINKTTLTSGTDQVSNFNPELFDPNSEVLKFDPSTVTSLKSEESMQSEIMQMSYLMLHPSDGRSYRKELIYNGISDFLYEQYNRIVFGGKDSVYSGSASKSNSGFLAIETYSNNFLTGWFLKNYADIAVWMIAVCVISVILIGLLKSRKISWFVMSIFTVINVILLVPASGEIVPYISSSMVQKMFSSKMTYWGIAEGIANASIEQSTSSLNDDMYGLTSDEATLVTTLTKQINNVYTDRSLMLKQDISQKVTQKLGGVYTEIQNLQSARWILPTIMQQYTADQGHEDDYVYVSLSNVWDDGSNLYWYFNPDDASFVTKETATSHQFFSDAGPGDANTAEANTADKAGKSETYDTLDSKYNGHTDETWSDDTGTEGINYDCYCYTVNDKNELVHLYSWANPNQSLTKSWKDSMGDFSDYKNADSWDKFIDFEGTWNSTKREYYRNNDAKARTLSVESTYPDWVTNGNKYSFEQLCDQYDRAHTETLMPGYSYYKTTESPYYYFFNVVKDTFNSDNSTFGSVIGKLQGQIKNDENGNEVRSNFMYATKGNEIETEYDGISADGYTGYIRDVADLEELFTNVIPYMYTMTLYTGGFDGESGILLDSKISDESDYYKGMDQSWAYRCNWAVKLMENGQYSKPTTAYRNDGGDKIKEKVNCPVMYAAYENGPLNRPMVFSEAQKEAYGLVDADLTLVELKCIKVNKDIAKKWTLLINYAGTPGMTKEVLFREMATIATNSFCQEFSTGGLVDNKYSIYPQSLDLRYLSFDSVMKLLMINVSKDTSYVYGDTMSVLLEETDMFTALLLLISAFMCAYFIPLVRCILMAMIFYLGFLAIIRALFSSTSYKGKIACGQFVSNILFLVYTLAYYACFCGLMALSSSDEVLSVNNIQATPGNPVWMIIAIIAFSGIYIYIMWRQICFCFAHYRDMGFEVYSTVASAVTGKIQDAIDGIGDKVSNFMSGEESTSISTSNTNSIRGAGLMNKKPQDVNINQATGSSITLTTLPDNENDNIDDIAMTRSFESGESGEYIDNDNSDAVNAQIRTGEEMNSDS